MGFTLNKFTGVHANQELNAFRNASSEEKSNSKILSKMGALFSKKQHAPANVKNKKPALRFSTKQNVNTTAVTNLLDEVIEVRDFFDEEDGTCAPVVSRISFSSDEETKSFAHDRCAGKEKAKSRKAWGAEKRRIISDFARGLIPGIAPAESTLPKGTLPKGSSERSLTSIGSFATYNYDDLLLLNSEKQNPHFTTSSSSLSPWDTPRDNSRHSSTKIADNTEDIFDALPKTDSSWTKLEKRRVLSDFTWSIVAFESSGFRSPKKASGRCKTSLLSDEEFYDSKTWLTPSWSKNCSARLYSSDSFRTTHDDDVAPWFMSRR